MAIIFPGSPSVGDTYEAPNGIIYEFSDGAWRLSAENQGSIGVHMDTSPPANPQNGDLWFHTGEADLKIFYIDPTSSQWIPASSPPDPYEENFVSINGDTMTGRLTIVKEGFRMDKDDGTRQFTIGPNKDDYYTNIWAHNCNPANNSLDKQGGIRIRSSETNATSPYTTHWISEYVSTPHRVGSESLNARTGIFFLQTPTKSHHAANKQYVDDELANAIYNKVPGRRYKYSTSGGNSLSNGSFYIESSSGAIQLSRFDSTGCEIATTKSDNWSASVKFIVTIRNSSGAIKHAMSTNKFYQGEGTKGSIKYDKDDIIQDGRSSLVSGTYYYIADGIYCI